ncbi:hypothetical protein VNO77_04411 [Canavalia gladiata]|uniref:Uncharacterized protein n=1 Tax=Canavalia gladiata TaxID=3824 RepID=A0AAN9R7Q8_CANGL
MEATLSFLSSPIKELKSMLEHRKETKCKTAISFVKFTAYVYNVFQGNELAQLWLKCPLVLCNKLAPPGQ